VRVLVSNKWAPYEPVEVESPPAFFDRGGGSLLRDCAKRRIRSRVAAVDAAAELDVERVEWCLELASESRGEGILLETVISNDQT